MSDKALTRYKLLDDVRGEVIGATPRLVHDFCEGYEMVDADNAAREIAVRDNRIGASEPLIVEQYRVDAASAEREIVWLEAENKKLFEVRDLHWKRIAELEARLEEAERELLLKEGDNRSARSEQSRLQARVLEVETVRDQLSQALSVRDHQYKVIEQERDRLRQRLGDLEAGKECVHLDEYQAVKEDNDRLRAELIAWKHSAKSQDALDDENERLRGLIGALPLLTDDDIRGIELGRHFSTLWHSALATLLRERQEMEEKC